MFTSRVDGVRGANLACISHQVSAASADSQASQGRTPPGLLDVLSSTPSSPSVRAALICMPLHALATKPGEICRLADPSSRCQCEEPFAARGQIRGTCASDCATTRCVDLGACFPGRAGRRSRAYLALKTEASCVLMSLRLAARQTPSLLRNWIVACEENCSAAGMPIGKAAPLPVTSPFDLPIAPPR